MVSSPPEKATLDDPLYRPYVGKEGRIAAVFPDKIRCKGIAPKS
jgi:hypothetical protein